MDLARRNWELWSRGADDEAFRTLPPNAEWHHNIGLGTPLEGIYSGRFISKAEVAVQRLRLPLVL